MEVPYSPPRETGWSLTQHVPRKRLSETDLVSDNPGRLLIRRLRGIFLKSRPPSRGGEYAYPTEFLAPPGGQNSPCRREPILRASRFMNNVDLRARPLPHGPEKTVFAFFYSADFC